MALFDIRGLSFAYPGSSDKALDDVSLTVERGELVALMGATGSGKSTLLRLLKPELRQNGDIIGEVVFDGRELSAVTSRESAMKIGYVAQSPDEQIVTDKVWHELAFTLENLGAKREDIARRIAEITAFFDIDDLYGRDTSTLSGGEKQLVNLAAVMTADPEVLLLDEPTAQLDPVAASRFIETIYRLNRETGLTVIISEHRSEELLPLADRLLIIEQGRIVCDAPPRRIAEELPPDIQYLSFLPTAARLFRKTSGTGEPPLSIREGQRYLERFKRNNELGPKLETAEKKPALEMKNIWFRYERNGADILRDMELTVYEGEVFALLGSNGAGKSTAAMVAAGLRKPYSGSVRLFGKPLKAYANGSLYQGNISLLPQDAESVFLHETVRRELQGCEAAAASLPFDFSPLLDRHPYDISGGERQLVALCKALSIDPRLLIADEPSKGLDHNSKELLRKVMLGLKERGVTVIVISHDVEFAAMCADRCALFSQGTVAAYDETRRFLSDNRFYTTAASRITRRIFNGAVTEEQALSLMEQNGGDR